MGILTDLLGRGNDQDDSIAQAWRLLKDRQKDDTANAEPVTQKITYNPDGTQSHTISATTPAKPVSPMEDYNAYIAGQESGNNPNIGYHDRNKSTAYGQFGITDPAYQDVQRADPRFANRGITELSAEEQRAANEVLKAQYERQLQAKGVEPTEGNVRLAHLLGAGGANQYLTQGTFNQAAIDANGGEERLRQLAQQRLASAAPQGPVRPQPQPQNPIMGAMGKVLNAVIPSAQAGTVPQMNEQDRLRAAQAMPGSGTSYAPAQQAQARAQAQQAQPPSAPVAPGQTTNNAAPTAAPEMQGPPATAMGPDAWVTRFATAQQDPKMIAQIAYDPDAPKWVRSMAEQNLGTQIQNKREAQTAQQLVNTSMENGDMRPLAGAMNNQDGSWVKYYLYNRLGLNSAATKEANRLGLNDQWQKTMVDGTPMLFKTREGMPVEGINGATGEKLNDKELLAATAKVAAGKVTTGAEFFQDKKGNIYQAQRDESGGTRFVNTQTNKSYGGSEALVRLRDVSAVDVKRQTTMIQMAKELSTMDYGAKLKALEEFRQREINAGRPDLTADEMAALIGGRPNPQAVVGGATGQGSATAPGAPAAGGAPSQGAPAPGAPAAGPVSPRRESVEAAKRREAEEKDAREVSTTGRKDIVKESSQIVGEASKLFDKIDVVDTAIKNTRVKNNMGQIAQGTLPGERYLGQKLGTDDARATDRILDGVKLISAEGMKVLGANPTDADRDYLTANIPNETWSAEATREWLESRRKFLERKYDIAKKQISSGGTYVPEIPPAPGGDTGTTTGGNKYKRVN